MRSALVVTEIACALVLLAGAGLMMKSFVLLHRVNLGFDPQNILTFRVTVGNPGDKEAGRRLVLFLDQLLERTRALPGVRAAAAASIVPLDGSTSYSIFKRRGLAGALALSRFITDLLFGVPPTDPGTLAIVTAACIAISLIASLLPAKRAAKVDPILALHCE